MEREETSADEKQQKKQEGIYLRDIHLGMGIVRHLRERVRKAGKALCNTNDLQSAANEGLV